MAHGEFTLAEVARRTGASPRSIQLWANAGALRPVQGTKHAGTGRHRQFTEAEVEIAALLVPFASLGITIGKLARIADAIRRARGRRLVVDLCVESRTPTNPVRLVVMQRGDNTMAMINRGSEAFGFASGAMSADMLVMAVNPGRILTSPPYRTESA